MKECGMSFESTISDVRELPKENFEASKLWIRNERETAESQNFEALKALDWLSKRSPIRPIWALAMERGGHWRASR